MLLADKILYLRKKNGWSQEELAERLDVSRQSVSKWESASSIPEMNKIIDMATIFGVTTDYLLRDELEDMQPSPYDDRRYKKLSIEDALQFIRTKERIGSITALATMMCIVSPAPLIILGGLNEYRGLNEKIALGLGLGILFLLIASAVAMFIISEGMKKPFGFVATGDFELSYGVEPILRERLAMAERNNTVKTAVGVVLCILCALPLVAGGIMGAGDLVLIMLVALLLVIVAVAVFIFIQSDSQLEPLKMLLTEGQFAREKIEDRRRVNKAGSIYWPIVTAIYLFVSFMTMAWDKTWLVWPVAALIFGGITALIRKNWDTEDSI